MPARGDRRWTDNGDLRAIAVEQHDPSRFLDDMFAGGRAHHVTRAPPRPGQLDLQDVDRRRWTPDRLRRAVKSFRRCSAPSSRPSGMSCAPWGMGREGLRPGNRLDPAAPAPEAARGFSPDSSIVKGSPPDGAGEGRFPLARPRDGLRRAGMHGCRRSRAAGGSRLCRQVEGSWRGRAAPARGYAADGTAAFGWTRGEARPRGLKTRRPVDGKGKRVTARSSRAPTPRPASSEAAQGGPARWSTFSGPPGTGTASTELSRRLPLGRYRRTAQLDVSTLSRMGSFLARTSRASDPHGPGPRRLTRRFNAEAVTVKDHSLPPAAQSRTVEARI